MPAHRLHASQFIRRPIEEVFSFFAEPRNLARITPSSMGFEFQSDDFEMREGLEIRYRLRPLFGVPVGWRTRIDAFDPPHGFRDIQLAGPYRRWEHSHAFRAVDGGTVVEDEITYELPLGPLGELGHGLVVRPELERIFSHRARTIESVFAMPAHNPAPLTIAVAGGTGFVGGSVALELFRRGHRVVVLSSRGEEARGGLPDGIEIRTADVTADADLAPALEGADALVISLAFRNSPMESPRRGRTFEAIDAAGSEKLVAAAAAAGVGRLLYLSGAGAAPNAQRHWFRAKWRAEEAVRGSDLAWTIIRPTWIYGPRDVSLNRFVDFARRLQVVPMTNFGRQSLAPVFIDDVADLAADALLDDAARDQVFELGGPQTLSMKAVIGEALDVAGINRPILPGPAPLLKLGAVPLQLLPSPPLTPAAVDFINQPATVDIGPLLSRMPRRLTTLREGLESYLAPGSGPATITFDEQPNQVRPAREVIRID
jgi:uncharacterized protein YbjT (DUF2867 family)/ligand-binding SRPBCC domain-containing protein